MANTTTECDDSVDIDTTKLFTQGHNYTLSYTLPNISTDVSFLTQFPVYIYAELVGRSENNDELFCSLIDIRVKGRRR